MNSSSPSLPLKQPQLHIPAACSLPFRDPVRFRDPAAEQGRTRIIGGKILPADGIVMIGIAVCAAVLTGIVETEIDALDTAAFPSLVLILPGVDGAVQQL